MEGALDAQSLISLSLRKIHSSRSQRGGIKLHKNLLVSYVLRNARQLYLSQRYAELCRRQQPQPQPQQLPYPLPSEQAPFPPGAAPTAPSNHFHDGGRDFPPPPPPSPPQFRSCSSSSARSSEGMEELLLSAPSAGMPFPFYPPHRPLPLGPPLPIPPPPPPSPSPSPSPPYPPSCDFGALPSGAHDGAPLPPPPCPSRTTVLDLDTHVVTTVDNGFLHQDCGCAHCPTAVGAGTAHPAPSPSSPLLQSKRRYVQEDNIHHHDDDDEEEEECDPTLEGRGAVEVGPSPPLLPPPSCSSSSLLQTKRRFDSLDPNSHHHHHPALAVEVGTMLGTMLGTPPHTPPPPSTPFKRKYEPFQDPAPPPLPPPLPPSPTASLVFSPCPKRARLEDSCEPSNISNLISIFGSGFTGLVGRQQQQQQQPLQPPTATAAPQQPQPQPSPTAAAAAAATTPPPPPESEQQQQQQQHLNGQLCSKQALASLGAWTRAIVAF